MAHLGSTNSRSFLLTAGGPTYRIEQRVGLIQASSPLTVRRALLSAFITWIPLLILSALQGTAIGYRVPVPFLRDFAAYTRFLLAVPILVMAEIIVGPRLAEAASHFVESGLVTKEDFGKFDSAVEKGLKWRDSTLAEIILVCLAYVAMATSLLSTSLHISTWYLWRLNPGVYLTWAGWWYVLFCVPFLHFLALRWLWRLFLWAQFLWRMNQLNLQLTPTHPDEAGGLAFVGESQRFFGIILLAFSTASAGVLADRIIYEKAPLPTFGPAIAVYVVVAIFIIIAPLFVFSGRLLKTKRAGLHQYGTFATEYTSSFHRKWITGPRKPDEELLGTGDIQSLADLGNSFAFIERMNPLPMGFRTPINLVIASLIPIAPLLLTMMPLKEILEMVFKVVM
jgi:hypothetical protein